MRLATMKMIKSLSKLFLYTGIFIALTIGTILTTSYVLGPPDLSNEYVTVLYDQDGGKIENTNSYHKQLNLDEISPLLIEATILVEDKNFYEHHGFDYRGIMRAIVKNIRSSRLKEGASTITQQYARNLYLTHEKTWIRKIKEAFYTVRLEMFYSKDEILRGYLNSIYYGHGAYGIEAASHVFFEKNAKDLTLAEAAMLAGVPKGPTYYSPFNNKENAFNRQDLILNLLLQENVITQASYYTAKKEQLQFDKPNITNDTLAPFFEDVVLKEAKQILGGQEENILTSGYRIYTTLDQHLQKEFEKKVAKYIDTKSDLEIAAIALDPKDGGIISLVGGKDYQQSPFNRATDAKRMVGSTFKPFLYYAALENGYTATTMLLSEPTAFVMSEGDVYKPSNYNGYYANKPISLAQAIALSDNIYAVKTNLFLSPDTVAETTKKFGIKSDLPAVPSLALGSASITLLEMVQAYGRIANGGEEINGYTIKKIENHKGKVIYEKKDKEKKQVLDQKKAFILTHLMQGMFDRRLNGYMEVTGSSIIDKIHHAYAGKSGTTDSDSWMIGFSPSVVTGVWTGYDDNQPIQIASEKSIAKNVWAESMEAAHSMDKDYDFTIPDGIVEKVIDPETGMLATNDCETRRTSYFEKGTEPTQYCTKHLPEKEQQQKQDQEDGLLKRLFDLFK